MLPLGITLSNGNWKDMGSGLVFQHFFSIAVTIRLMEA
jgi:hypothetical protein